MDFATYFKKKYQDKLVHYLHVCNSINKLKIDVYNKFDVVKMHQLAKLILREELPAIRELESSLRIVKKFRRQNKNLKSDIRRILATLDGIENIFERKTLFHRPKLEKVLNEQARALYAYEWQRYKKLLKEENKFTKEFDSLIKRAELEEIGIVKIFPSVSLIRLINWATHPVMPVLSKAMVIVILLFSLQNLAASPLPDEGLQAQQSIEMVQHAAKESLRKFINGKAALQNPLSLNKLVDDILPQNILWVHYNGGLINGKQSRFREENRGVACRVIDNYVLTADHIVDHIPLNVWTTAEPVELGPYIGKRISSLSKEDRYKIEVTPFSLIHPVTKKKYAFRVIVRDEKTDVAILEMEDAFRNDFPSGPVVYLDSRPLAKGDTVVYFMDRLKGSRLRLVNKVKDRPRVIKIKNGKVDWMTVTARKGNDVSDSWYLEVEGTIFPNTRKGKRRMGLDLHKIEESSIKNISTLMGYDGNSGSLIFRKEGDNYYLISVLSLGVGAVDFDIGFNLYGLKFQRTSILFPKPDVVHDMIEHIR